MAKMVPLLNPKEIENYGERFFYQAALSLPDEFTVFYSLNYFDEYNETERQIREADFVIVHPFLGFVVVEVKQGEIAYIDGQWCELESFNDYKPLSKNPTEQARTAMFSIINLYKKKTGYRFPLKVKYAVAFPECKKIYGSLPLDLEEDSVFAHDDLDDLENKILNLLGIEHKNDRFKTTKTLIDMLSPSFKAYTKLEDKIEIFHQNIQYILTKEQERIIEETELDKRKIFFGAAGTGKTFIAMEKAKKLADQGKKVLLTCYNKNLAKFQFNSLHPNILALNFHDLLLKILKSKGFDVTVPKDNQNINEFYSEILPNIAFDHFMEYKDDEKYDSVIVDEGQDFKVSWITCLESMIKEDGEFYIFADPNQSLFNSEIDKFKGFLFSRHKLTRNLRNSQEINQWIGKIVPEYNLKTKTTSGMKVCHFSWKNLKEEKKKIEAEIGRLVSQGIRPKHITILSPYTKERSSLAGVEKIKDWPLINLNEKMANGIKFSTIRSFKGLEDDIIFLIGIKKNSRACTDADIYVGGSRARFLLYIFHDEDYDIENKGWLPNE